MNRDLLGGVLVGLMLAIALFGFGRTEKAVAQDEVSSSASGSLLMSVAYPQQYKPHIVIVDASTKVMAIYGLESNKFSIKGMRDMTDDFKLPKGMCWPTDGGSLDTKLNPTPEVIKTLWTRLEEQRMKRKP